MTDPDAWMNDISSIVRAERDRRSRTLQPKDKRDREQHAHRGVPEGSRAGAGATD